MVLGSALFMWGAILPEFKSFYLNTKKAKHLGELFVCANLLLITLADALHYTTTIQNAVHAVGPNSIFKK